MSKPSDPRIDTSRVIHAPQGTQLHCKNWQIEAAYRMLQNNLDPDVAENPQHLVVYGGIGRAARNWECFDQILESLKIWNPMSRCWFSPVNPLVYLKPILTRHVC